MESLVAALAQRFASSPVVMSVISLSGRAGRVGTAVRPLLDQFHVLKPMAGVSMVAPLGLVRCLRRIRPDVVHVHSGAWYKGALAARLAGVRRIVYTEHGREPDETTLTRWLDQRAARWTDVVVAVSDCLRRYMETALHVPPHRIQTIENCIDVEVFTPGPPSPGLWDALGIPQDAFVIGSVGRLETVKAFERMIEALARIRASGEVDRPVYLVICGEGSQRQALEECARHWGVADAVRFPGWVDQPVAVYRSLDVFALTSLSEGASISLMEAMACGTAPVVMAVGANAEILGPDLEGQVVPAGDLDAFQRTVVATLTSPERLTRVRALARARTTQRYAVDRMVTEYERTYRAGGSALEAHRLGREWHRRIGEPEPDRAQP